MQDDQRAGGGLRASMAGILKASLRMILRVLKSRNRCSTMAQ